MKTAHLVRRFVASVIARPTTATEEAWVTSVLEPAEFALWKLQPRYDRRHTLGVARRVDAQLGEESEPRWLAAALMHDVGKVEARIGITGRVLATLLMGAVGRPRVVSWVERPGWRGRFGRYGDHGAIGARLVRAAGGREEVARWADVHHRVKRTESGTSLGIPANVFFALRDSDRD